MAQKVLDFTLNSVFFLFFFINIWILLDSEYACCCARHFLKLRFLN